MPTYSYECQKCGHIHDEFHSIKANPRIKCTKCGGKCRRKLGKGAGIIFKGSGFYETDYKKKSGGGGKSGESKSESKSESSSESKSESKSEGKSETKTEAKAESKSESTSRSDSAKKSSRKKSKS